LKDLGVAKDSAVAQAFGFDVAAVLDVVAYQATELDRGVVSLRSWKTRVGIVLVFARDGAL
jgi:hypothetical protein